MIREERKKKEDKEQEARPYRAGSLDDSAIDYSRQNRIRVPVPAMRCVGDAPAVPATRTARKLIASTMRDD